MSIRMQKHDGIPRRRFSNPRRRREDRIGLLGTGAIRIWPQSYARPPIVASVSLDSARLEVSSLVPFAFRGTVRTPFPICEAGPMGRHRNCPGCGKSHGRVNQSPLASDHVILGQTPRIGSIENTAA